MKWKGDFFLNATIKIYSKNVVKPGFEPWVAGIASDMKPDFTKEVGGFKETKENLLIYILYVTDPVEGMVYAYGLKDQYNNFAELEYAIFKDGIFHKLEKNSLVAELVNLKAD